MDAARQVPGALDGLLVVSIEQAVAAPACTVRLADAGARVIKIERAEGETARHYDRAVHGMSAYFAWLNRGKESVCLDLKQAGDLALVHRMVARADIFVQNLAPGATGQMNLGAEQLLERHPALIVVDIVGYGQDTPYRHMRAYDMLVQAESGICAVTGTPERPCKVGVSIADIASGMNAHALILEALIARGRTGKGRAIEIAMFDSMADWMSVPLLHHEHAGRETARHGLSHASIYPYSVFSCRGGDVAIAIQQPAEWKRFCEGVLRMPALVDDARFSDNSRRVAGRQALDAIIAPVFASLPVDDMIGRLDLHQIAWGRVSTIAEAAGHPALRRIRVEMGDDSFMLPAPAGRRDFTGRAVPALGGHTDRIRAEFGAD